MILEKKKKKGLSAIAGILFVLAAIIMVSRLIYLYHTPNSDFFNQRNNGVVKELTEYTFSETIDESAPVGIIQEYRFYVSESLYRKNLVFYGHHQYVRVFLEGELLYQWCPTDQAYVGKTLGCRWISVPFFRQDIGKEILVEITPVYSSVVDESMVFFAGAEQSIYEYQLRKDGIQLVLSMLTICTGLTFLIFATFRIIRTRTTGWKLAHLGAFAACIGLWHLTDIPFVSYVFENRSVFLYDLSIMLLMICMIPLVLYVGNRRKHRWPVMIYVMVSSVSCVVQMALQMLGIKDLRDMLTITHVILLLGIVTIVILIVINRHETKDNGFSFYERRLPLIFAVGVILDLFHYYDPDYSGGLFFTVISVLLYIFISGVIIIQDYLTQEKKILKQDKQLLEARTEVMLSQIQPHFLYNTLNSIAELCWEDADQARTATIDFAEYLRVNLKGIKEKSVVPFSKELEHVKRYLALEKMRFEEQLNVVYDIRAVEFEIPQLAIQPLVENAVKYGVGEQEEGGTVTIRSYEENGSWCVSIEDDGVGFDMEQVLKDGKVHVGIENSRMRIHSLCGGTLEIQSTIGQGTTALIRIPKEDV